MLDRLLRRRPKKRALFLLLCALALYFVFYCLRNIPGAWNEERWRKVVWESIPDLPTIPARNVTSRKLLLLQMLFRHGHRAPFNLYPNDEHDESFWKEGMGQLTQLGRLQHFVMGDHLLKRYQDFITQDPNEVELLTADSGRCQYGSYTFVAGLYPPTAEKAFTSELMWQPIISRHYPEKNNRWVLSRRKCPVAGEEEKEYKMSREADDVRNKYQPFYDFWSEHSGRTIKDWTRAADLGKTMACERDYNLSVPEWGLRYWKELELQAGLSYYWNFRTRLIQRYRSGPLLSYMLEKIHDRINGSSLPEKKVLVYSAHGSNIACLLLALGQYNFRAPPHASTVVLELWAEEGDFGEGHAIRWLYFNSSSPERRIDDPVVLRQKGCSEDFCPLEEFMEVTRDLIPDDWTRECIDLSQRRRFPPPEYIFLSSSTRNDVPWVTLCIIIMLLYILK